jgi:hypothetical protein
LDRARCELVPTLTVILGCFFQETDRGLVYGRTPYERFS